MYGTVYMKAQDKTIVVVATNGGTMLVCCVVPCDKNNTKRENSFCIIEMNILYKEITNIY